MIAPNFSRMRIKSEVFYVPLSDLYPNFHDVIMNYKEESSTVVENGVKSTTLFNKFPHIKLNRFAWWFNRDRITTTYSDSDPYNWLGNNTYYQNFAVSRLIHQMGVPYDITVKDTLDGSTNVYAKNSSYLDYYSDSVSFRYNVDGSQPVSLFPFQAYQYVYNWFYRDSVRSYEIDTYPDIYSLSDMWSSWFFGNVSTTTLDNQISLSSQAQLHINRFMNSLFQVRRRFYRKDYFNTSVSDPTVGVDSLAVPENIVDLRKVNQLQKFIEKRALTGDRVAEWIASHWAVKPDSYEVGKPILISSSSQNVQISEVLQTSESTTDSAQGTRSGTANSYGYGNGSFFVSPDYGVLLINMTIVPEISYFSGMPRKLAISRWEHFAFPEFAQIGMQPIFQFELSRYNGSSPSYSDWPTTSPQLEDLPVFGYAPRYSEYKMELDQISGEMATSLRFWHQSPSFEGSIGLNKDFGTIGFFDYNYLNGQYTEDYLSTRYYNQIFAVEDDRLVDHCQVIGMFDITVNRALPANDMPAL